MSLKRSDSNWWPWLKSNLPVPVVLALLFRLSRGRRDLAPEVGQQAPGAGPLSGRERAS